MMAGGFVDVFRWHRGWLSGPEVVIVVEESELIRRAPMMTDSSIRRATTATDSTIRRPAGVADGRIRRK